MATFFLFEKAIRMPSNIDKKADAKTRYSPGNKNTIVWQGIHTQIQVVNQEKVTMARQSIFS